MYVNTQSEFIQGDSIHKNTTDTGRQSNKTDEKQGTNRKQKVKQADLSSNISIITLIVYSINTIIKTQRMAEWIKNT